MIFLDTGYRTLQGARAVDDRRRSRRHSFTIVSRTPSTVWFLIVYVIRSHGSNGTPRLAVPPPPLIVVPSSPHRIHSPRPRTPTHTPNSELLILRRRGESHIHACTDPHPLYARYLIGPRAARNSWTYRNRTPAYPLLGYNSRRLSLSSLMAPLSLSRVRSLASRICIRVR
ncbi:hypothetical protein VTO73DRAFT_12534 [Trametes versicolor]